MTRAFSDHVFKSADGLQLYARRYEGDADKPVLLCLHGLTRNSADFHPLAEILTDYPIISVDQRGRGKSDFDPKPDNYTPATYCQDMFVLLEDLNLDNVVAIGTSMGGLMTMMMSAMRPGVFTGAVINDIGPEVDPKGLKRLATYVGQTMEFDSWPAAASAISAQGTNLFPEFTQADWIGFARRTCVEGEDGKVRFAYDPAISAGLKTGEESAVPPDLWPVFDSLTSIPVLLIRGENSDILSAQTAEKMVRRHDGLTLATIPQRGHAPILNEPYCIAAITHFLETLDA